jgi:hypothetical protein
MSTSKKASLKIITSPATLSYPHLDKPQPAEDGKKPKFSATLVFEPRHLETPEGKATMAALQAAAVAAAIEKFGAEFLHPVSGAKLSAADAIREGVIRSPFRKDAAAKGYPVGSIFVNARTEQAPGCVFSYKEEGGDKPAKIPQESIREVLYAGAQVRASVVAFGYNQAGNKGVSFALNNVQKVGEGKRLDNRTAAEDEFTADLNQTPADLDSLI